MQQSQVECIGAGTRANERDEDGEDQHGDVQTSRMPSPV